MTTSRSIQSQLTILVFFIGLITAGIVLVALNQMKENRAEYQYLANVVSPRTKSLWAIQNSTAELSTLLRELILVENQSRLESSMERFKTAFNTLDETITKARRLLPVEDEKDFLAFTSAISEWRAGILKIETLAHKDVHDERADRSRDFDREAYIRLTSDLEPKLAFSLKKLSALVDRSLMDLEKSKLKAESHLINSKRVFAILGILGIIGAITLTVSTVRAIDRQLKHLLDYFAELEKTSDLTISPPELGRTEFGQLSKSIDSMRNALLENDIEIARTNEQLKRLVKRLSDKNDEIERFVYTVSHDLKSPLVTCTGFVGMLREDLGADANSEILGSLDRINRACGKMSRIIDELLQLSRIGRDKEDISEISVDHLIRRLVSEFSATQNQANIDFHVQSSLPKIQGRASAVERAFENLFQNALRYGCTATSPCIEVGSEETKDEIRFFVADNGVGIEKKYRRKVFGLFKKLENSEDGTGVGLASVYRIMQIHHGNAWVEENHGGGARFWLSFPREAHPD